MVHAIEFPFPSLHRFVEFATIREAVTAIQQLNMFDMGSGNKLIVKISERAGDREKRLAKKLEEENFLNSLHCARKERGKQDSGEEEFEMNEDEAQRGLKNPFLPQYTPVSRDATGPTSLPPSRMSPPAASGKSANAPVSGKSPGTSSLESSTGLSSLSAHSGTSPPEAEGNRGESKLPKSVNAIAYLMVKFLTRCSSKSPLCNHDMVLVMP